MFDKVTCSSGSAPKGKERVCTVGKASQGQAKMLVHEAPEGMSSRSPTLQREAEDPEAEKTLLL